MGVPANKERKTHLREEILVQRSIGKHQRAVSQQKAPQVFLTADGGHFWVPYGRKGHRCAFCSATAFNSKQKALKTASLCERDLGTLGMVVDNAAINHHKLYWSIHQRLGIRVLSCSRCDAYVTVAPKLLLEPCIPKAETARRPNWDRLSRGKFPTSRFGNSSCYCTPMLAEIPVVASLGGSPAAHCRSRPAISSVSSNDYQAAANGQQDNPAATAATKDGKAAEFEQKVSQLEPAIPGADGKASTHDEAKAGKIVSQWGAASSGADETNEGNANDHLNIVPNHTGDQEEEWMPALVDLFDDSAEQRSTAHDNPLDCVEHDTENKMSPLGMQSAAFVMTMHIAMTIPVVTGMINITYRMYSAAVGKKWMTNKGALVCHCL